MHPFRNVALLLALTVPSLMAHPGHEGGVAAGLLHPLTGIDHLLAMVAVGVLAARLDGWARWWVPGAFLMAMGLGGGVAMAGIGLPLVEPGIILSVVVFGVLIAMATPPHPLLACGLVALLALPHGHAHVAEMGEHHAFSYLAGFMLATAALHAGGLLFGLALRRVVLTPLAVRSAGASIALGGLVLAVVA